MSCVPQPATEAYGRVTARDLPISSIVRDASVQIRAGGLQSTVVERYRIAVRNAVTSPNPLPPVTVADVGGVLLLVDGFHRIKAHELESKACIQANVVRCASSAEARWLAAEANLFHGLPITRKDRRAAFQRFIRARRHCEANPTVSKQQKGGRPAANIMSLGEIAAVIGASKSSVRNWMREDFARVFSDLYKNEDEPHSDGQHLEPYIPFRGEIEVDVARCSFVNLGAALEGLPRGPLLNEFVAGLSNLVRRVKELHGQEAIHDALEAGWQEGWFHKPVFESDF